MCKLYIVLRQLSCFLRFFNSFDVFLLFFVLSHAKVLIRLPRYRFHLYLKLLLVFAIITNLKIEENKSSFW